MWSCDLIFLSFFRSFFLSLFLFFLFFSFSQCDGEKKEKKDRRHFLYVGRALNFNVRAPRECLNSHTGPYLAIPPASVKKKNRKEIMDSEVSECTYRLRLLA